MKTSLEFTWRKTNAPVASSRTDDIFFVDPNVGWAVNSNGQVLKTSDGGDHWDEQIRLPGVYLRCVSFANPKTGWVGSLTSKQRLWSTHDGTNWTQVSNIPANPNAICGLSVVSESVVYGSGTNFPNRPPGIIKTLDGGKTWSAIDMSQHASLLVDIHFEDELRGWVVGGKGPGAKPTRDEVSAVVLYTEDGGKTWVNRISNLAATLPKGEWGWKIFFLNDSVRFVSLENFKEGAILKTTDGGQTWSRHVVNDPQHNANLEGIGFVNEQHGWVGGWGTPDFSGGFSSETLDGGSNWRNANDIGRFLNRFRFFHVPKIVGYSSGDTVYKYDDTPVKPLLAATAERVWTIPVSSRDVEIPYSVDPGDQNLQIDIWDRFGEHLVRLLEQKNPQPGTAVARWNRETTDGQRAPAGFYIYRVSSERSVHSAIFRIEE
jgi:photosystem II stability/assembly factor-like uncharacterized protein